METVKIVLTCPYCGHDEFTTEESGSYRCTKCGKEEYPENMTAKTVQQEQQDYPQEFTEITTITCYRNENGMEIFGPVYAVHKPGNILEMIDECCTQWFLTKEGAEACGRTCRDYNIGDWMNEDRPDDAFTRKFGFIYMEELPKRNFGPSHTYDISFHHDRLLGTEPEYPDEE